MTWKIEHRRAAISGGFTLVEVLIVVIVLAILAAIALPQLNGNSDTARVAALDGSLTRLRNAVELYYHQHGSTYPGVRNHRDGSTVTSAAAAESSFVAQLTLFSDAAGRTRTMKDDTFRYGPYLIGGIPANPFNRRRHVVCRTDDPGALGITSDGSSGWMYFVTTGRLVANDGAHDAS